MRAAIGFFLLVFLGTAAAGQERGSDPDKFELTDFVKFGEWELFCGHFGDPEAELCDLRRTDIISPRPSFRAMVISWTLWPNGPRLDVGAETTTTWLGGGIKIDGERVVAFDRCAFGRCVADKKESEDLLGRLAQAKSISLVFNDLGTAKEFDWELKDMRAGMAALDAKLRARLDAARRKRGDR